MDDLNSRIEKKAYDYFIERGMSHGQDVEDWLKAEKEILAENRNMKKTKKTRNVRQQVDY